MILIFQNNIHIDPLYSFLYRKISDLAEILDVDALYTDFIWSNKRAEKYCFTKDVDLYGVYEKHGHMSFVKFEKIHHCPLNTLPYISWLSSIKAKSRSHSPKPYTKVSFNQPTGHRSKFLRCSMGIDSEEIRKLK